MKIYVLRYIDARITPRAYASRDLANFHGSSNGAYVIDEIEVCPHDPLYEAVFAMRRLNLNPRRLPMPATDDQLARARRLAGSWKQKDADREALAAVLEELTLRRTYHDTLKRELEARLPSMAYHSGDLLHNACCAVDTLSQEIAALKARVAELEAK